MAIPQLTDEQVRTWSVEQKDRWWLANVFRGNMAQLTIRSAITGFLLGGILSATNLYIGAKTGWTLGVGLTSVILAFATFRGLSALGGVKDFTILENNAMQSIATSAGYMTGPLISGMAAYMFVTNHIMPWWQMLLFNVVLSILGVLVAFPMKRRFINDEQLPFPEGAACGVVLDTLYTSDASVGIFKAKALAAAAGIAAFLKVISAGSIQLFIQAKLLGMSTVYSLSEEMDHWVYWTFDKLSGKHMDHAKLAGVDIRQIGIAPGMEVAMVGAGGLMGVRSAVNMMVGMVITWVVLVPIYISQHVITPKTGSVELGTAVFNQRDILIKWPLWPGVCMVVLASLVAFFAKPKVIISAFTGLFAKKKAGADVLKDIEVPNWISFAGIPLVGAVGVWMAHEWFQVPVLFGALAILLIMALTLIAVNATGLTSITPTGSLSKITQLTFGLLDRAMLKPGMIGNPAVNLMTATMTTEVASNAANLLMDIKPGYMLGAKPRQQIVGHCIGILAGAIASTPLFFLLFLHSYHEGDNVMETMTKGEFSFTAGVQWKGLSDVITGALSGKGWSFHQSVMWAMVVASIIAISLEVARIATKNKLPVSPVALGLGVVLPPESTMAMFFGSVFFWSMERVYHSRKGTFGHKLWVDTKEPICAGLIAGWSLMGIADILAGVGCERLLGLTAN
jgi:OPT family oligopeptide transporter